MVKSQSLFSPKMPQEGPYNEKNILKLFKQLKIDRIIFYHD